MLATGAVVVAGGGAGGSTVVAGGTVGGGGAVVVVAGGMVVAGGVVVVVAGGVVVVVAGGVVVVVAGGVVVSPIQEEPPLGPTMQPIGQSTRVGSPLSQRFLALPSHFQRALRPAGQLPIGPTSQVLPGLPEATPCSIHWDF